MHLGMDVHKELSPQILLRSSVCFVATSRDTGKRRLAAPLEPRYELPLMIFRRIAIDDEVRVVLAAAGVHRRNGSGAMDTPTRLPRRGNEGL